GRDRAAIVATLRALGVRSSLLVANPGVAGFDGALGLKVLADDDTRAKLVETLGATLDRQQIGEYELDLEGMPTAAAPHSVRLATLLLRRRGRATRGVVRRRREPRPGARRHAFGRRGRVGDRHLGNRRRRPGDAPDAGKTGLFEGRRSLSAPRLPPLRRGGER